MYPPSFDYYRATDVSEALSLLADLPDATVLAGGHALVPHLKNGRADPGAVVDVSDLPALTGVEVGPGTTVVGAATTYADLLGADLAGEPSGGFPAGDDSNVDGDPDADTEGAGLGDLAPAFAGATRAVGDRQIRNRGTVGGNLAEAHPGSDLPAAALVAGATVRIRGPDGDRTVGVSEFVIGAFESAVGDDELVTAVRIPHVDSGDVSDVDDSGDVSDVDDSGDVSDVDDSNDTPDDVAYGGAYVKKTHPASGYAMVGVAARVAVAGGVLSSARVAANGVAAAAVRLPGVETALGGVDVDATGRDERLREAVVDAACDVPEEDRRGDVHASAEYRASVLPAYVERAVRAAVDDAVGGGPDSWGGEPR